MHKDKLVILIVIAMCQSEDCVCVRENQDGTITKAEEECLTGQHGA